MLYNVLPPLIFFVSFGGIILVVSRVAMRSRREQFSHSIQMEARHGAPTNTDHLFSPNSEKVQLRSRIGAIMHAATSSVGEVKTYWSTRHERKAAKKAVRAAKESAQIEATEESTGSITMPTMNWQQRAFGALKNKTAVLGAAVKQVQEKSQLKIQQIKTAAVPLSAEKTFKQEQPITTTPHIRIMRVDQPVAKVSEDTDTESKGATEEAPQGRFIARLQKAKAPQVGLLDQAHDAIEAGQLEKAEELLVPYIMKHAKDCQAYMLLGQVSIARSQWQEAMEIFQQVIHIDSNLADAQTGLGYAALQQGRFSIALQALQKAHATDPQNVKILEHILNIAQRLDNKVLQKSVLEQLVELQPTNEAAATELQGLLEIEKARSVK